MIGPSFTRHGLAAWLFLAINGILGPDRPGADDRRNRVDSRTVLHHHRTDHQRDHPAHPGRHPAARRQERCRGQGQEPDPGVRVPPRRDGAGNQRVRDFLRPGQPDLQGAGRRQADGGLRTPAAQGVRRAAGRRLPGDRDGLRRDPGPDHPRGPAVRPGLSRAGAVPGPPRRPATPTCSWACSIARPTSGWSGPPTRRSITSWPTTSASSARPTR